MSKEKKLIPRVREVIRTKHYSYSTEKNYVGWILRYIRYHKLKHPKEMGDREVIEFLSYLANERNVSANTQNQALNAIIFLYKQVLKIELGDLNAFIRAKKPRVRARVACQLEFCKYFFNYFLRVLLRKRD